MLLDSIIGHRGCAGLAPENTEAGIRHAYAIGLTAIEVDVAITRENRLVIFHDESLSRCSNGKGKIHESRWSYLRQLDTGSWFDTRFNQCRILQLKQLFALTNELNLKLNLELKVHSNKSGDEAIALATEVTRLISEQSIDTRQLLISSLSHEALATCNKLQPELQIGHLFKMLPKNWLDLAKAVNAKTIHLDVSFLRSEQALSITSKGYLLYVYTVNSLSQYKKLQELGVSGIFTDFPDRFLTFVNQSSA